MERPASLEPLEPEGRPLLVLEALKTLEAVAAPQAVMGTPTLEAVGLAAHLALAPRAVLEVCPTRLQVAAEAVGEPLATPLPLFHQRQAARAETTTLGWAAAPVEITRTERLELKAVAEVAVARPLMVAAVARLEGSAGMEKNGQRPLEEPLVLEAEAARLEEQVVLAQA